MKKLILALAIFTLTTILALFIIVIPQAYHHVVHQKLLKVQHQEQSSTISKVSSLKVLKNKYKLRVQTNTFLNPLKNYIDVKVFDSEDSLELNFQIFTELVNFSEIKLNIHFSDKEVLSQTSFYSAKGLTFSLGNFSLIDFMHISRKNFGQALLTKSINLEVQKLKFKKNSYDLETEAYNFELKTQVETKRVSILSKIEAKKILFNSNYKNLDFSLKLDSMNEKTFIQLINKIISELSQEKVKFNPFTFLSYLQGINYPLKLETTLTTKRDNKPIDISLKLELKSRKFLNSSNYKVSYQLEAPKKESFFLLRELILREYSKNLVKGYQLGPDQSPSERFMQRDLIKKKIKSVLTKLIEKNPNALLEHALEQGLFIKNPANGSYQTSFKLENKQIELLEKRLSLRSFSNLIVLTFDNYLRSSEISLPNHLKSEDLSPIP